MKEPKTYKFATFQEMVDVVPSDRIIDCLSELARLLCASKASIEIAYYQTFNKLPESGERIMLLPEKIEWVDDGRRELVMRIHDKNDKFLGDFKVSVGKDGGK